MLLLAENCELTLYENGKHKAMRMSEWDVFNKRFATYRQKEDEQRQKEYVELQAYNKAHNCPICKKKFENPTIVTQTHKGIYSTFTITVCPTCIMDYRENIYKIETVKHKVSQVVKANFNSQFTLVEHVRIGSHREHGEHGRWGTIVEDKAVKYHDSLVSKEWLEAHINDQYDEPTIDITVDNGKTLHVNGNYEKKMIENFMSEYTEVVRAGKSNMRINKGDTLVKYGNLYFGMNDEELARNGFSK